MIDRLLHSRLGLIGACLIGLFCVASFLVPFAPLNLVATSINISLGIAVFIAYAREGWAALQSERPSRADRLALGICVAWLANSGQRIIALGYRLADNDPAWLQTNWVNFFFVLTCLAATLHLTAPHAMDAVPPIRRQAALWIALAIGAGVAGFALGFQWHRI